MSKARSTGNLNNAIQVSNTGAITFVSGSTTLASFNTTGPSTVTSNQYISSSTQATGFTDTASLYTDGGLRVGKDAYVSGTLYLNNLTVYGTQSVNFITSSQLDIADNIITVNTSTPAIRFGGIAVRDSGSLGTGLTGSLLWDSQNNHWIYTNPSGSSYSGGMMISGPRASSLGEEQGTTFNALMKGQGGDHITSSGIFESGSNVGIGTSNPSAKLQVEGTGVGSVGTIGIAGIAAHLGLSDASRVFKGWVGYYNNVFNGNDIDLNIKTGYKENSNIRFSTNGDSGEAMRITSGSLIGIGTSSPAAKLEVRGNGNIAINSQGNFFVSSGGTAAQAAETGGQISFGAWLNGDLSVPYPVAAIKGVSESATTDINKGALIFATMNNTTNAERMRITSGGDILIAGGNTSGQSSVSTATALRFPNQYSNGYTDAGVKLFIFNSGATIQGLAAGPAYDLQYHSSGDNTNGKHAWYVGNVQVMRVQSTGGNVTILGSLSKGSGSFRIKHPLASKKNTHQLVHSFIEGPQADLIYSGGVTLVNGRAVINIDEVSTMTEGTFEALCRNIRVFTSNETSWDNVRGKVEGNILTIECQNTESTDEISWLVVGERQDEHMFETEWTDSNGKVIVEPLIPADPGNLMQENN
jgi:hypothetical protein